MIFGRKGLLTPLAGPRISLVITSSPSRRASAVTAVSTPSEIPAVTSMGRANSPSLSQRVLWEDFCVTSFFGWFAPGGSDGGSLRVAGRTSGAICAREEGDQRRALLGTSR